MENLFFEFSFTIKFLLNFILGNDFLLFFSFFALDLVEMMVKFSSPSQNASDCSLSKNFEVIEHLVQV